MATPLTIRDADPQRDAAACAAIYAPHVEDSPISFEERAPGAAEMAARIERSPAFRGDEPASFARHWIQCFVSTDLCGFGILAFGSTFELDYVFDPFFREPTQYGG